MVASLAVPLSPHVFVKLPHVILLHPNLSLQAKLLYGILRRYAREKGYCYPGYARLAEDMRRSERTVRRAMDELVAAGIVGKWQRGLKQTNVYYLASPEKGSPIPPDRTSVSTLDRPLVTDKRDEEKRDEEREIDLSKAAENCIVEGKHPVTTSSLRQRQSVLHDPDRDRMRLLIEDIARQLNDRASLSSTTSRLLNVMRRAGISFDQFAEAIYEARKRTLERANIRDRNERGTCRMGYFFSTLEQVLTEKKGVGTHRLSPDDGEKMFGLAGVPSTDRTSPTVWGRERAMTVPHFAPRPEHTLCASLADSRFSVYLPTDGASHDDTWAALRAMGFDDASAFRQRFGLLPAQVPGGLNDVWAKVRYAEDRLTASQ